MNLVWIRSKSLEKREYKIFRLQNQAKLRSYRTSPKCKFGHEIPRNNDYDHAASADKNDGNHMWADCVKLETCQQHQCDACKDMGAGKDPKDHKNARAHFVFNAKYDGSYKARLVADLHLTDVPLSSVYSGVESLRGIRLVLFIAELNSLESWGQT